MCELAHRQVPESTGHAVGGFVEGAKVSSWPAVPVGILSPNDS